MNKVVTKGLKIDLHIHSVYSQGKDGKKVQNNTKDNLPVLVQGLLESEVELCSITDHDTFNYEMYHALKKEENECNCIKKVLPGIEFSVEFLVGKVIHIVTIFDDKDDVKIKNLEEIMVNGLGKSKYKNKIGAYSKKDYFEILQQADLDFIMIAHQKKTVTSQNKPHQNDVLSLGEDIFNELVFLDYFDAFEFRNKKNEIYNKAYVEENNLKDNLRFITGSDCHDWKYYPNSKESDSGQYSFTYIKSLPTFKGVAMAITDPDRIGLVDKFFNPVEEYINEINMEINDQKVTIPMSKGINVIIGDNSVGKSLFLNAITGNYKINESSIKRGYSKYLDRNNIKIEACLSENKIFMYNRQGEIREIFDSESMKPDKYLVQFYPNPIDAEHYRKMVEKEFEKLYELINKKFEYDQELRSLPILKIFDSELSQKSISFVGKPVKKQTKELSELINSIEKNIMELEVISNNVELWEQDKQHIINAIQLLQELAYKYSEILKERKRENEKINVYNTFVTKYKQNYNKKITDEQAIYSEFIESKKSIIKKISEVKKRQNKVINFVSDISEIEVIPEENPVDCYKFISKLSIEVIDKDYIEKVISSVLKKNKKIDTTKITENDLKEYIKNYPSAEEELPPIEVLKTKIADKLNKDFRICNTIVEKKMNVYEKLSSGFDAQTYFTLISGETRNKGVYIIDQPEDHISQKAIKENVLKQFKRMGQNRQIIMVTHNPQFIVNLDVDNVIYLSKEDNKFLVKSGALEYENADYSILNIIADNIEGGLQTILGRMKRYEKSI